MLPTLLRTVKSICCSTQPNSPLLSTFGKDQRTIWLLFGGSALLIWATGMDSAIAHLIYQPDLSLPTGKLAWWLRQVGAIPGALAALMGLIGMLWPGLWHKRPTLYQTAVVMALTTILGAGLINQVVIKDLADRPRPRESVLQNLGPNPIGNTTITDGFRGNSMPSGHAAMGFVLTAPFFTLRRRHPKLAATFLAGGLSFGTVIGMSRMMLGAHFATDVLIAALISLSVSSALATFLLYRRRFPALALSISALLGAGLFVAVNRIENHQLTMSITENFHNFKLPCPVESTPVPGTTVLTLTVNLNGYGAPASNLKLFVHHGFITLQTHRGLYHHLSCTANLAMPTE